MIRATHHDTKLDAGAVLTKATLRAAAQLGLADGELAETLGTSAASVSRLRSSARAIDPRRKEGEIAVLFVRMYRSLDALFGDTDSCRKWFHAENTHLGGIPAEVVRSVTGLVHVTEYLDAMRGKL